MLLCVDIGNTDIKLGVYQEGRLLHRWRLTTKRSATADEYAVLAGNLFGFVGLGWGSFTGMALSSTVPPLTGDWQELARRYIGVEPLVVGWETPIGLPIRYENPSEVGADRLVNAVAGIARYGTPLIIVDFGTATTLDVISADGAYLGGAIAPGVGIATEALFSRAARLPRIELKQPKQVIGRTTVASMQSGIVYGFAGQVDALVDRIMEELGERPRVVATGGLAELIAAASRTIGSADPFLTLDGLEIIYSRLLEESQEHR